MGRLGSAGGRDRGGDGIQAVRASSVRVAAAAGSLALLLALGAYAAGIAPVELRGLVAFPAAAALLLAGAGVLGRWPGLLAWGLAACLAAYASGLLAAGGGLDPVAPLFAAGLLAAAELGYWSIEERAGREPRRLLGRRFAVVLLVAAATAALGSVVLVSAQLRPGGGPAVLALGVAAAVAVLALLARLAAAPGR